MGPGTDAFVLPLSEKELIIMTKHAWAAPDHQAQERGQGRLEIRMGRDMHYLLSVKMCSFKKKKKMCSFYKRPKQCYTMSLAGGLGREEPVQVASMKSYGHRCGRGGREGSLGSEALLPHPFQSPYPDLSTETLRGQTHLVVSSQSVYIS